MANLLARGAEEPVVRVFKKWAGEHGRSADAEHRVSLREEGLAPASGICRDQHK